MFTDDATDPLDSDPQLQLRVLLAWIQHFYITSLEKRPTTGHAIVIAGRAGKGKSLFTEALLGGLMTNGHGGHIDGEKHLVDNSRWTDTLADCPVMGLGDALSSDNFFERKKFTNRIKKYVASGTMNYDQKYGAAGPVPWFGRIVITCNIDPESLQILPDLDMSTRDKIMFFKTSDLRIEGLDRRDVNERRINRELGHFARFLVDWQTPEELVADDPRFGVNTYHHPDLVAEVRSQGPSNIVLDVVLGYLREHFDQPVHAEDEYFEASPAQLYAILSEHSPAVMRGIRMNTVPSQLGILMRNGFPIERVSIGSIRAWRLHRALLKYVKHDE